MRRWLPLLLLWTALAAAGLAVQRVGSGTLPAGDVAAANDVAQVTAAHWPTPAPSDYAPDAPDFTVLAEDGRLVVAKGTPLADEHEAVREHATGLAVRAADGTRVATVLLPDARGPVLEDRDRRLLRWCWGALLVVGLSATAYLVWLDRRILRPFRELRDFADRVAHGNLDEPLRVDRGQVFGAFTQSFDVLRTELARSRARELAQRQAHKRLVGQLSHDIRTPLASISASTEVLQLNGPDPRLDVIAAKTAQIDALLGDLTLASTDELDQMPVHLTALASTDLVRMVTEAQPSGWPEPGVVERAMVVADPQRLQQVVDNVVANAAKYGAPPLRLGSHLSDGLLEVTLTDAGPGVPADELALLSQPHYRASNAAGRPGQGLGLFTAAVLMEAMGGSLDLANGAEGTGFVATLTLALAEGPHDPRRGAFRTI
ncbi:HAMP domain-containing sensor histidine kinase [Luteococcus sp. H138]|uniref:HAMP domain-containing sensor histidine kinase n=1 Tax=unclassified Luteococcus TaxID=2639923 RepID=UPI00313D0554